MSSVTEITELTAKELETLLRDCALDGVTDAVTEIRRYDCGGFGVNSASFCAYNGVARWFHEVQHGVWLTREAAIEFASCWSDRAVYYTHG